MPTKAVALFLLAGAGLVSLNETGYRTLTANHIDQVLLVSFWATWCEPCRAELAELAAMERAMPVKNFRLAVVSIDEPEQAKDAQRVWSAAGFHRPGYVGRFADRDRFISSVDARWSGALPARTARRSSSISSAEL